MAMEYINYIKAKTHLSLAPKSEAPVLSEEDEHFLNRITSDVEAPPPLPARPNAQFLPCAGDTKSNDAQSALMNGAQNIPLPDTPTEWTDEPTIVEVSGTSTEETTSKKSGRPTWSWLRRDSRDTKRKNQEAAAGGLTDVAAALKPADAKPNEDKVVEDREAKKEEEDMTIVLERLNLAAVNNRVFSISDETQELLQKFNQIFKDLVNGVPTAYDDLESLLTNGDRQLQRTFSNLPSFLQKLIETLPAKMTQGFAPEIIAAAAERAERSGVNMQTAGKAAAAAKKMGFKTPSLKDMIGKPGAVATMMRSIIGFLRARFPAFLGMNVLWSLALFGEAYQELTVLLEVTDSCHSAPIRLLVLPQKGQRSSSGKGAASH